VLAVGCSLGVLAVVWWLAVQLGRSPQRALACVGFCPVTLAVGLGGFHNDGPALLCIVGAAAMMVRASRSVALRAARPERWDAGAAALVVAGSGFKPSFAVALPIVLLGAQRRTAAVAGALWAAAALVAIIVLAFGGALPAVGVQSRLVTPLSLPNLGGVLTGHGGADAYVRAVGRDVLIGVVLVAAALVAWRRRLALPALGVVLLAAAATLSWVMPWYLGWALPFAALARPRALVPVTVAACLWLGVGGIPQLPSILHAAGYYPTRSATGLANHDFEVGLVR
jgi:hypothetical protein